MYSISMLSQLPVDIFRVVDVYHFTHFSLPVIMTTSEVFTCQFIPLPERHHFILNVMQHMKFITPSFTYYMSAFVPALKHHEYYTCN